MEKKNSLTKSIYIHSVTLATASEWDFYWENCPTATYFESREWADIWAKYLNGKLYYEAKKMLFSDGVEILIPYSFTEVLGEKFYLLSCRSSYGGLLYNTPLNEVHLQLIQEYILKSFSNLEWTISPLLSFNKKSTTAKTSIYYLSSNFKEIFKKFRSSHQRAYRKSLKENCSLYLAQTNDEWKKFYNIYFNTAQDWGKNSPFLIWNEFQALRKISSKKVKLWLVKYNNVIIAGGVFLHSKYHIHYWIGASKKEFQFKRPMNFLYTELIKQACEKGYSYIDFGPSLGKESLLKFKQGFGTQEMPFYKFKQRNFLGNCIDLGSKLKKKLSHA